MPSVEDPEIRPEPRDPEHDEQYEALKQSVFVLRSNGATMLTAGEVTADQIKAGSTAHDRLLLQSRLKERIETKIEEFKEYKDRLPDSVDKAYEYGIILGLSIALQTLEES